jgi:spore coat protein H
MERDYQAGKGRLKTNYRSVSFIFHCLKLKARCEMKFLLIMYFCRVTINNMQNTLLLSVSFLLLMNLSLLSQPAFPPNMPVFDSSLVARVDILINSDTLAFIYDNPESDIDFRASFILNNGTILDTLEEVGFQLRGNTSRYSLKKSFRVSFNTFVQGRKFHGLEKLCLNGEHNDPSIIRSRLCWETLRSFGIAGPRASHTEVYINGNYYGLYIIVEYIDEQLVQSRFGNSYGNLYKCLWPADLAYLGTDPDLYKFTSGDRRAYALITNTEEDDYADIAHFIDVLNNTPLNDLACELDKVFNLDDYLKILAADIITGNWDGYIYNKNNFYLYHNTETGKFEYMPYDLDNTYGIDWMSTDWGNRDIYDWEMHDTEVRPLYVRLLEVPEIRDRFSFQMQQLLELLANEDSLFAHIDQVRDMISPYVIDDPFYPLDYGYNFADFMNSYNQPLGGHVAYGLKPYIQTRKASAFEQLEQYNIHPVIKYINHSVAVPGLAYSVSAFIEDESPSPSVKLAYKINNGAMQYVVMYDDGNHGDGEAGDDTYGCILAPLQMNTELSWQVSATDTQGNASLLPCDPVIESLQPSTDPQIFINELMAANNTTIADENGEYDDWVEIFNMDSEPVWLGDKYLSDNINNPSKWRLPDVTLQPGGFFLVWADNQPGQGPAHATYKLDAAGEEVGLFDAASTGYFLLDSISFGPQSVDISLGRQSDGGLPWVSFNEPTPGYGNGTAGLAEQINQGKNLHFFPNPVTGGIIHFGEPFSGKLIDRLGMTIWKGNEVMKIDVSHLQAGIYIILDSQGNWAKIIIL